MNKWQREVLGNRLASEETILKEIRNSYKQALKEIDDKVAALLGRLETEEGKINKQAIEYQLGYQKALQTQIKAILETMNTNQFETISEYLKQSYDDGFIGTMYDLQKQGIPIVAPIDEQQVVRAIKTNSKLSKDLWGSLAEDNSELQVQIRAEISSGISQGRSYSQIARQLAERMSVGYSKTARIVRTESHRISQEATLDAQYKAKETGADIVKQWDSTLDRRTRSQHAQLDGQIREIDEPFEYGGHKAMHPSGFGVAALDINCRCVIVQRAKWALDEEELKVLEDRAKYFGLDKAKDFEEYKKKYIDSLDEMKDNTSGNTRVEALKEEFSRIKPIDEETARKEFDEISLEPNKYTAEEKELIYLFTGSEYAEINGYLRNTLDYEKYKETQIKSFERHANKLKEALKKSSIPKDVIVYRGTHIRELEGIIGEKLAGLTIEQIKEKLVGKTFVKKDFTSTSIDSKVLGLFKARKDGVKVNYILPEKSQALYVNEIALCTNEKEIILQCNSNLEFFEAEFEKDGTLVVNCKVVGYEE